MGGTHFRFGTHNDLEAECYPAVFHDLASLVSHHAIIGMDRLSKFDAFGWELNPFKM